jgi:hypothetical protein
MIGLSLIGFGDDPRPFLPDLRAKADGRKAGGLPAPVRTATIGPMDWLLISRVYILPTFAPPLGSHLAKFCGCTNARQIETIWHYKRVMPVKVAERMLPMRRGAMLSARIIGTCLFFDVFCRKYLVDAWPGKMFLCPIAR